MKQIFFILFLSVISVCASATESTIAKADSAYTHDDFILASKLYTKAIDTEGSSVLLYYNLGNTYYRMGKLGKAIVYYERALRLDPTNEDARTNLEFVNTKITDQVGDNGMFISNTFDKLIDYLHPNSWGWLAVISFLLFIIAIAVYVFAPGIIIKKTGFFGAIILLIVSLISNIFAYKAAGKATSHNHAIVIEPATILSTSPRLPKDRSEEALLLHEGTKVEIIDSVTSSVDSIPTKWYDVKVDNSHRAWINSSSIEKI